MPENGADFKLKFEGQLNEVDASTLGYSLVNITTVIREINSEIGVSRIDIRVKAVAPGSFFVHLGLAPLDDPLFQASMIQAGSVGLTIIRGLTELLKLRKELKGEPPKEIIEKDDEIHVRTGRNSTVTINKTTLVLHHNPAVNEALSKMFRALESDPSIEGFRVTDEKEESLFEAEREDFAPLALTTSVPRPESQDITTDTHVYIVKPSFDPKLKWEVLYKGNRISVWLRDKTFQRRIEKGERFAKGDVLAVRIRIHQKLDKALRAYVNKSFEIVEVKQHIPREEEQGLFFDVPPLPTVRPPTGLMMRRVLPKESSSEPESEPKADPKPKTSK